MIKAFLFPLEQKVFLRSGIQSAFFDFCAGNHHQSVARARVKAVNVTPKLWIVRVEVA